MRAAAKWMVVMFLATGGLLTTWVAYRSKHRPSQHFVLQILHASDLEAGLDAIDDAPRMSSVLRSLQRHYPHRTLLLSSGDNYIAGPFYNAGNDPMLKPLLGQPGPGRADIAIANAMGFQASALGNHEFDEGVRAVASLLQRDTKGKHTYEGALFPYLSATLDFRRDKHLAPLVTHDGQEAKDIPRSIARSAVITVMGEPIGIVGATTPRLAKISSPGKAIIRPDNFKDLDALAAVIQEPVDALRRRGINKIILLSHMQQLAIEKQLATRLKGVDIIIGGGSDSILADKTDRLRSGDMAQGPYPIWYRSPLDEPVALLNTDGQYRYVGRFVVHFDAQGRLLPATADPAINGAYPTDERGVQETGNVPPHPRVLAIARAIEKVVVQKDGSLFGATRVFLNGRRIAVRREETNLGNLTADADLFVARQADPTTVLSFKNGGAIRNHIGTISTHVQNKRSQKLRITPRYLPPAANTRTGKKRGQISQLDIENALRFNNPLVLLTVTAAQLKRLVEHGVSTWAPKHTPGRFPQIGGFSFSFDPSQPPGQRVRSLAILHDNGSLRDTVVRQGKIVGNPQRTFRMVTLGYLAKGGDGYPFPPKTPMLSLTKALKDKPRQATFSAPGTEQDALAEYLQAHTSLQQPYSHVDRPIQKDRRIQNLAHRKDTVLQRPSR